MHITLAAGMPRSASTWLYNAARLVLCSSPIIARQFSGGWIADLNSLPRRRFMLLKIHDYHPQLVAKSAHVLYSYRDLRDVIASFLRHFGRALSLEEIDALMIQDQLWRQKADFTMQYERMMQDPAAVVEDIARVLKIPEVNSQAIVAEIASMDYDSPGPKTLGHHQINLFHRGHITDGRHGSWHQVLTPDMEKILVAKYHDWFVENGYTVDVAD